MSSPSPVPAPAGAASVLVVDDEQGVLTLLELALKESGYDVLCAPSGRDAQAILESDRGSSIDVVILDYSMPGFDGVEVLRAFRSIRSVPVVLMSGYPLETIQHRLEEGEIAGFLQKPYRFDQLEQVIADAYAFGAFSATADDVAALDPEPTKVLS